MRLAASQWAVAVYLDLNRESTRNGLLSMGVLPRSDVIDSAVEGGPLTFLDTSYN